jgi:hypothetical protein
MPDLTMHASDWENIARCAEARFKAAYWESIETSEAPYGFLWGPLADLACRELNTCEMARKMASIRRQRSNA